MSAVNTACRTLVVLGLGLICGPCTAVAGTLPEIAEKEGFAAVNEEIARIVAAAKNENKLAKALEEGALASLAMPVRYAAGAELTLRDSTPLTDCSWSGSVTCRFDVAAPADADPRDFDVACTTRFGAGAPLSARPTAAPDGRIGFEVADVESCWELSGVALRVKPKALMSLDGVGVGDDMHAPELVELSQDEVEDHIAANLNAFRYCYQKNASPGSSGKLLVTYKIADDGRIGSATLTHNTLQDAAVESCVLERFQRLSFPPPMGGFSGGTWPFTFLK